MAEDENMSSNRKQKACRRTKPTSVEVPATPAVDSGSTFDRVDIEVGESERYINEITREFTDFMSKKRPTKLWNIIVEMSAQRMSELDSIGGFTEEMLRLNRERDELKTTLMKHQVRRKSLRVLIAEMKVELMSKPDTIADITAKVQCLQTELDGHLLSISKIEKSLDVKKARSRQTLEYLHMCFQGGRPLCFSGRNEAQAPFAAADRPTRYTALHRVSSWNCGRLDRRIRDLNMDTFTAMGQNCARWTKMRKPCREDVFKAAKSMLAFQFDHQEFETPDSKSAWTSFFCDVIKVHHDLDQAPHIELLFMQQITTKSNAWFTENGFKSEFQLPQQQDLDRLLGDNDW